MRYFIFFYDFRTAEKLGRGNIALTSGSFPPRDKVSEFAASVSSVSEDAIVITGWNEMTKEDFYSFTGTEEDEE